MPNINGKPTFSAGRFFGIANTTTPTPARAILPQDMSVDFKISTKELRGEKQFAAFIAAGEASVTGKVTYGANSPRIYSDLLFAQSGSTGQILDADKEAGTVPSPSGPYTITVANSAHFLTDLGVTDTSGKVYTRVASGPTTGQYSVSAGVYTFASADAGINVLISYLYTASATGEEIVITNPLQGPAGAFQAVMTFLYGTQQDVLVLNNAISQGAGLATKQGDFAKPTFDFMASTDSTDTLGTFSFAQAA